MNTAPAPHETMKRLPWFGIPCLVPFLKPFRKQLAAMILLNIAGSMFDMMRPLFQRYAIDHFIEGRTSDTVWYFFALYLAVVGMQTVSNILSFIFCFFMEMNVLKSLRDRAFTHLQTLSFAFFNRNSVGYLHSRIMSDTERIATLSSWHIMESVWTIIYFIGTTIIMLVINWKIALMVFLVMPVATVLFVMFQKIFVKVNHGIRELNSKITSDFNEGIIGAKTIKTLAAADKICGDFEHDTMEMRRMSIIGMRFRSLFGSTISFAATTAFALVLWRGGRLSQEGIIEIGTLAVFLSYAFGLMEPFHWISNAITELIAAQVNIERFTRLVSTESDVVDSPEVIARYGDTFHPRRENWEPLKGDIEFRDVSFRYPDGDRLVLEHFNLKVPRGMNIAIVGETGAGKSTLVNLVCRFFEPTSGQMLIDGRDARERSQLWLHSNIGYVLQTPHLFSGSVLENLKYGNPDATMEEIELAVKRVSADKVIARMEHGLDSQVGECGDLLSTGEKQLISFARAILANPAILILDEATSSVDTLTEAMIQQAIAEVIRGRTSFVIAHRLSTIRSADLILVVHDGKIIEQGTHDELMAAHGEYRQLCTRQYENRFSDTSTL